jgi:hypothetical protein
MAELKTKQTEASVEKFIAAIKEPDRRKDCETVIKLMRKAAGEPPKMWGESTVGFGLQQLKYASGRELDWMLVGFSPRKQNLALYIMTGFEDEPALMKKLGKYSTGKSCLYVKSLADIDLKVLEQLIVGSIKKQRKKG